MNKYERLIGAGVLILNTAGVGYAVSKVNEKPADPRIDYTIAQQEKLLGYLCHESNMRALNRLMTLEDCRKFRDEAYTMAAAVPSATPLPNFYRQATTQALAKRTPTPPPVRRGGN